MSKKIRNRLIAFVFCVALLGFVFFLVSSFLFRISNFTVSSIENYTEEEIIEASEVNVGDSWIFLDTQSIERNLVANLSNIEIAKVEKQFPSGITIDLVPAQAYYSVANLNMYSVISKYGKILSSSVVAPEGTTELFAGAVEEVEGHLNFISETSEKVFNEINLALDTVEPGVVTEINITDLTSIEVVYEDRVVLELGDALDLGYKIKFGLQLLTGGSIGEKEHGILDLGLCKSLNKAYFQVKGSIHEEVLKPEVSEPTTEENSEEESESSTQSESSTESNRGNDIPDF